MRKLQTSDIFSALRLIKKAKLKEEVKPLLLLAGSGEAKVEDIGIEGILTLVEALSEKQSEQGMYEFLAGPLEMAPQEVEKMDLIDLAEHLETLARENDLKRFFSLLSGLNSKV